MKRYFTDRAALRLLRLLTLLATGVLIVLSQMLLYTLPRMMHGCILMLLLLCVLITFCCLPLYFRNTAYFLSGTTVRKQSGIFILRRQTMQLSAVQYTTAVNGPFSGAAGLNFLVLNAFGGRMLLLFLSREDLDAILRTVQRSPSYRKEAE